MSVASGGQDRLEQPACFLGPIVISTRRNSQRNSRPKIDTSTRDDLYLVSLAQPEQQKKRSNPLSEFTGASMDGVQEQQAIGLADAFLHELIQELDHEDIV